MSESFPIHQSLPNGFSWANHLQAREYTEKGYVSGARKVCFVQDAEDEVDLAIVLGPPIKPSSVLRRRIIRLDAAGGRISEDKVLDWYIRQYNAGYAAANRGSDNIGPTAAWEDGSLDRAAGRAKWHLTHCANHDECGEG